MNKSNFLLVFFSAVFSIYLMECILYITNIQPYNKVGVAIRGVKNFKDSRSKAQFVQDARAANKPMVPDIPPHTHLKSNGLGTSLNRIFPVASISNSPTAYCNMYGKRLVYQSDRYGFRNPNSVYLKSNIDVVIVGDSFSAGHCEENDIGELLRQQGFNTVNFAYGGNGPLIELAALREYSLDLKPKVLLWIYFEGNDLKNLKRESKSSTLMSYLEPSFRQSLKDKQAIIDILLNEKVDKQLEKELAKEASKRNLLNIIKLKGLRLKAHQISKFVERRNYPVEEFEPYFSLFNDVLSRAKTDAESVGSTLFFVYLPQRERYGGTINELRLDTYHPQIVNIVEQLNIPIIDFTEVLGNIRNPRDYFPYKIKGHYNQAGYELLSEQITPRIKPHVTTKSGNDD